MKNATIEAPVVATRWTSPAPADVIERTLAALAARGIDAQLAADNEDARRKVLDLLPPGAEVLTMTSVTLDTIGLAKEINESGRYNAVRTALNRMSPQTEGPQMRKLGTAPDFAVGSAHAVTETGIVMVASATGSQLPSYVYGAGTLIWVVGAQKIVGDVEEGLRRIDEYLLDKESERARRAYGLPASFRSQANKVLLFKGETQPGRVKLILVNETVGH